MSPSCAVAETEEVSAGKGPKQTQSGITSAKREVKQKDASDNSSKDKSPKGTKLTGNQRPKSPKLQPSTTRPTSATGAEAKGALYLR